MELDGSLDGHNDDSGGGFGSAYFGQMETSSFGGAAGGAGFDGFRVARFPPQHTSHHQHQDHNQQPPSAQSSASPASQQEMDAFALHHINKQQLKGATPVPTVGGGEDKMRDDDENQDDELGQPRNRGSRRSRSAFVQAYM